MDGPDRTLNISTKDLAGSVVQIHPPRLNWPAKRTDGVPIQKSQALSKKQKKKLKLKNEFSQKVQEGREIRRTYSIFGSTRQDKLFIFVGVGVFYPLSRWIVSTTHAPRV